MKKIFGVLAAIIAIGGIVYYQMRSQAVYPPTEETLTYFIDQATAKVKTLEGYERMGLTGGVDGFTLRKAYPNLLPSDFTDVNAYQGSYFEKDGQLYFNGHAASNSAMILREGMGTLLGNIAARLDVSPHTRKGINTILKQLENNP